MLALFTSFQARLGNSPIDQLKPAVASCRLNLAPFGLLLFPSAAAVKERKFGGKNEDKDGDALARALFARVLKGLSHCRMHQKTVARSIVIKSVA